jgi:FemAB-related protein (PEP-CTERM system-associated)
MAAVSGQAVVANLGAPSVVVKSFDDRIARDWDLFVTSNTQATPFHRTAWIRALERTFEYVNVSLYAERGGRISGVLPLFLVTNWVLGRCLISTPFADYGGVCAKDEESADALVAYATEIASVEKVDFLELRQKRSKPRPGFYPRDLYVSFDTELASDPETQLSRLPRDTRYMIRKGAKAGFAFTSGIHQWEEFYKLFSVNWRRLGTPVLPKEWLRALLDEFQDSADLLMAHLNGRPVAGVLSFVFRNTLFPHYCGASADANSFAASNTIYWELMRRSIEQGLQGFDFGRSKKNTGAYKFKSSWNMQLHSLEYQVCILRGKSVPNFSPSNPKFALAGRLWSHMPLQLSTWLGPHIVRWFP